MSHDNGIRLWTSNPLASDMCNYLACVIIYMVRAELTLIPIFDEHMPKYSRGIIIFEVAKI